MKRLLAIFLALSMVFALAACGANTSTPAAAPEAPSAAEPADEPAEAKTEIKIGFMGPATGDMAFLGEGVVRVMNLVQSEVEEMGGINGNPVSFFFEDDAATSANATTAAQKLIDVNGVNAIVGPLFTTCVLAVKPLVNDAEIIAFTPTSADKGIFQENGYVYSLDASNEVSVHLRAQYLLEEKGFTKLAILGNYNDQTLDMITYWEKFWGEGGGEIVYSSTFNSGSDDFRTELTKIKEAAPEAIWIAADANEFQAMVRQIVELGLDDLFICTDYQAIQGDTFDIVGEAIDGRIVYSQNGVANDEATIEKYDAFCAKWAELTDGAVPEAHEALLYDCAWLIIEAMQESGEYSGEGLRQALQANDDFIGVTGYPVFDAYGRSEGSSTLVVYEGGVSTTLNYTLHD